MAVWEWIRFIGGAALILLGLSIFFVEIAGVFRFKYVLNRMHAAAMGDTLGLSACIAGLMLMNGLNFTTVKLLCVIIFLWLASPVSSHLIAQLEVTTDPDANEYEKIQDIKTIEEEGKENKNE
ncbi:MAG: monovalent cation/H(+) antiporter subunit G [Lachnospiraceae bacterium]|nr:monovalent cation/H(+) antiporter subunit G [Lachnospiraceae bacterium]